MTDTDADRIERFRAAVADLGLPAPDGGRDLRLVRLGGAGLLVGPLVTIGAYVGSHGTTNALSQRDYLVVALIGVAVTVAGGALFVAGSMARFLRFWLARILLELRGIDAPAPGPTTAEPASTTLFASRKDPL